MATNAIDLAKADSDSVSTGICNFFQEKYSNDM